MVTCGTVDVIPPFDPTAVEIVSCNTDTATAVAGQDTVNSTVEVRNSNANSAATVTATFSAASTNSIESASIQPGRTESISTSFVFDSVGTYTIDVSLSNVSQA